MKTRIVFTVGKTGHVDATIVPVNTSPLATCENAWFERERNNNGRGDGVRHPNYISLRQVRDSIAKTRTVKS